jgi:hypothetical protein
VLEALDADDLVINQPACFETALYTQLNCSCWGDAMADCPADAHWFCRSCTKDWKRVPGAPGVAYATVKRDHAQSACNSGLLPRAGHPFDTGM